MLTRSEYAAACATARTPSIDPVRENLFEGTPPRTIDAFIVRGPTFWLTWTLAASYSRDVSLVFDD